MRRFTRSLAAALLLTLPVLGHARLIQIIHTNDLHSYFKGYYDGRGGYARVATKIKQLRDEARAEGLEVLQLDGGDWGEGTSFFVSDKGSASVKALELLGIDVAVIGNHDHMMGGSVLGDQIRRADVRTKFISANIVQTPSMNLSKVVTPYVDVVKNRIPIRIIGLSTANIHYQYQISPGKILPPDQVGATQGRAAKKAGKELVIALTHIGTSEDAKLARAGSDIDVIVGGHSHTKLDKVMWVKNSRGRYIPIVQAWAHGLVVGTLTLDVKKNGAEVVDYKLHEVEYPLAEDSYMKSFVSRAANNRNQYFGGRWNEIIGETLVPMTGYVDGHSVQRASCWGNHLARMSRYAVHADVGMHLAAFEGVYKPAGEITYGDMVDNFPHFRKYGDMGWEISTVVVPGFILKPLMLGIYVLRNKLGVNFSGIYFKSDKNNNVTFELEERDIQDKALYSLAFPAEVGYALKASLPNVTARLFPSLRNTGKYYWPEMEQYIRENSPIGCQ